MTAAIVDDGVPDELGRSGLLIITDANAERAFRGEWRLTTEGRFVMSVGESIEPAQVAGMIRRHDARPTETTDSRTAMASRHAGRLA